MLLGLVTIVGLGISTIFDTQFENPIDRDLSEPIIESFPDVIMGDALYLAPLIDKKVTANFLSEYH